MASTGPPPPAGTDGPGPETWTTAVHDDPVQLVGARRSADEEFTEFVAARQKDLLRTAWLLVGDAHRAEELTQQALVRTYAAWPRARAGDPLAYSRRVLVNLRTDSWRRRRREVLVREVPEAPATDRSAADAHADRDRLLRALGTLTARQRRAVVLRHLVGLSEAEAAEALGVSVGTVKSTTSRALALLRDALARDGADLPAPRSQP